MEKRIRTEESRTQALGELQGENLDWQFAELDQDEDIEADLAALKARNSGEDMMSLSDGASSAPTSPAPSDMPLARARLRRSCLTMNPTAREREEWSLGDS